MCGDSAFNMLHALPIRIWLVEHDWGVLLCTFNREDGKFRCGSKHAKEAPQATFSVDGIAFDEPHVSGRATCDHLRTASLLVFSQVGSTGY
jgi:hypothetical protein